MYSIYTIDTYLEMLSLFFFISGFSFVLGGVSIYVALVNSTYEKQVSYECGFNPFSDARDPFHVQFYLISILFIIFDIEFLYFIPWLFVIPTNSGLVFSISVMYIFIWLCVFGYAWEWTKGCLTWV